MRFKAGATVRYYEKKRKNKYDPKIETVKYFELIDQNKI